MILRSRPAPRTSVILSWCAMALLAAAPGSAQTCGTSVPSNYLDLCNTMTTDLGAFNNTLNGLGGGSSYPVLLTGELTDANATNGPQLVQPNYWTGIQTQLQELKSLGVQAIEVRVDFPMLYRPFFASDSDYQQWVTFLGQLAQAIRADGMKLIVENTCMMSTGDLTGWAPQLAAFYPTLDWPSYQAARAQAALNLTQVMQPDYLVIVEEPDNEALFSGQTNAYTPGGSMNLTDAVHTGVLQSGVPNVKVGAGVGSWQLDYQTYIDGYAQQQCSPTQPCVTIPLDFIDMHIYPINNLGAPSNQNFLQYALNIAQIAAAAGKPATISECFGQKVRDSELHVLTPDQIMSRNAFSFWSGVDSYFLQTMETFASAMQMPFMVPFPSQIFSGYITYTSSLDGETPAQIYDQWFTQSALNLNAAVYTSIGINYYHANVPSADTIPPSTPPNFSAVASSATTVNLSWGASTDNIGVAGYHLWRNGVQIFTSAAQTMFGDSGLTGNTTYTYQVGAFDVGGNVSITAVATVTTLNNMAPNPPTNLTGVAVSGQQINLTWTAPSGGAPVTSYVLFRGSSPNNLLKLTQLGSTVTHYSDHQVTAGTTYYYGVEAMAKGGFASPISNVVEVTTPAPPSAPSNVTATAISSTYVKVAWSPSSGGLPISVYHVYRGTTPSNVTQDIGRVTILFFNDRTVSPATTYYYNVQAIDIGGGKSPKSAIVAVTTP